MLTIILAAALSGHISGNAGDMSQQPRSSYTYDDARTRPQESPQERARREFQERWPNMQHCRLPACSTK